MPYPLRLDPNLVRTRGSRSRLADAKRDREEMLDLEKDEANVDLGSATFLSAGPVRFYLAAFCYTKLRALGTELEQGC